MFYFWWFLILLLPGYLIFVRNPFDPTGGVQWNIWSYLGLIAILLAIVYAYNNVAGVPSLLEETRATPFRQVESGRKWAVSLPASKVNFSDQEKADLTDDAQQMDASKAIKSFDVISVDLQITKNLLPIEYANPRFFLVEVFYKGEVTFEAGGTKEPRTVYSKSIDNSSELTEFLEGYKRDRPAGSTLPSKAINTTHGGKNLPGRLK